MADIATEMGFKNEDSAKTQHYKCKQKLLQVAREMPGIKQFLKQS